MQRAVVVVARIGRICKWGTGDGLEKGRRGRYDVIRAHGGTLAPPTPPVSDKTKGTRKVDIKPSDPRVSLACG